MCARELVRFEQLPVLGQRFDRRSKYKHRSTFFYIFFGLKIVFDSRASGDVLERAVFVRVISRVTPPLTPPSPFRSH